MADPTGLRVTTHDVTDLEQLRQPLLDVYAEVYADKLSDPFFGLPRYWERVEAYASRAGFGLALGHVGEELIGYAMGFTLPAGSGWWRGLLDEVDPDVTTENGTRSFGITEIMILESYRRQGHAKTLHDALLKDRPERRAVLLVLSDNTAAQAAYKSWGWYRLGGLKPFDDSPVYDAMVLDLD
jgi:ribosomal protein S18 acetylase RimI-like enzyme